MATASTPAPVARGPTLTDRKPPTGLRLVVSGPPGTGKSTLASWFPRPIFVDSDVGLASLSAIGRVVMRFEPQSYDDLVGLARWCIDHREDWDTIVFDSWTELQRVFLEEIVSGRAEQKGKQDRFVPAQAEYLSNQNQLGRILTLIRKLGKHAVLNCGVREMGIQRVPAMAPSLLTIVHHWADVMAELDVNQPDPMNNPDRIDRYLVFQPTVDRMAKSRFPTLRKMRFLSIPDLDAEPKNSPFDMLWSAVMADYVPDTNGSTK